MSVVVPVSTPLPDAPVEDLPTTTPSETNQPPTSSEPPSYAVSPYTAPSRLRAPKASVLPTSPTSNSSPEVRTLNNNGESTKAALSSSKPQRRTISIGSFPHPPTASRPPTASSMASPTTAGKRTSKESITSIRQRKPLRSSTASITPSHRMSDSPSLLNGAGESRMVSSSKRASDGVSSGASPPQSRSSSANGSYSTNATTIEDPDEDRGRTKEIDDSNTASRPGSIKKEIKGNVIVSVRVRPDNHNQESGSPEGEWMVDGRRALVAYRGKESGDYHYDNVFGTYDDNAKVYDSAAKRLVRRVMEGYHGTVFAYGMTGTGKTFSMQGTMSSPGVIPLAITDIFSYIRETPNREFLLRVSYLEIYNEKIHDLLATPVSAGGAQEEIKIREDRHRGVYATPLKEEIVQSPTQLLRVIHRGDMARRTGSTQYNARSSRSHAVVQIVVESRERIPMTGHGQEGNRVGMLPGGVRVSTLSLIDLAGSERAAEDKERRAEGAHINKSLLTLGTVIAKLSGKKDRNGNPTDKDGKHLPYRDSKLTRLLQPALSGNSLVSILCTIQIGGAGTSSVTNNHTFETLNTLKFAARAKNNIVSHAKRATEEFGSGVNAGLLERYRAEIANLRAQLETQQKSTTDQSAKPEKDLDREAEREAEQRREEQMLEMQLARTALKERIEHLNRLILCSKSTGVNRGASALGMHPRLSGGIGSEYGSRSVRSSASQSTLGTVGPSVARYPSMTSISGGQPGQSPQLSFAGGAEDEEDNHGEYGDGRATLQAQNRALLADLQDKNRYIATLEKRLLQARRSSHSRASMGFSKPVSDDIDVAKKLDEKDAQIADLQRTVTALRSAMRQRSLAEYNPELVNGDVKLKRESDIPKGRESRASARASTVPQAITSAPVSPINARSSATLLAVEKPSERKRKSVDEMSKMLDEMIQDKVESGHLIKGKTGSVRIPRRSTSARGHSRGPSVTTAPAAELPTVETVIGPLRKSGSPIEPGSAI